MRFSKQRGSSPAAVSINGAPTSDASMGVVFAATILTCSPSGSGVAAAAGLPALRTDQFRTVYEAPKNPVYEALYRQLQAAHALERFRAFLSPIRLPRALTLKLAGCDGDENAWYDPTT